MTIRSLVVSRTVLAAATLVWLGLIVTGITIMNKEAYQAAPRAIICPQFPPGSKVSLAANRRTLLLFIHPKCPCSEATFTDLEQIRTETRDQLAVTIIFTLPPGVPKGWEKGTLLSEAQHMRNIHIFMDVNGLEARRFGVTASGHTLLYTPQGHLIFSGGITSARGHAGDSPGESAIIHLTKEPAPSDTVEKPVFGCTLL